MSSLTTTLCQSSFQIFYSALRDSTLVFSGCVSHVVSPTQLSVHKITVLGFGEDQDQGKVFVALPGKGNLLLLIVLFASSEQKHTS